MKPVILLVDDEPDLLQVLRDALGAALPEYDVANSTCFEEATRLLSVLDDRLSLVVVDHMLGGPTGLDFLERLRVDHPQVPSMLFTGQATSAVEERARALGARVVWKPVRLRHWLEEVQMLLAMGQAA